MLKLRLCMLTHGAQAFYWPQQLQLQTAWRGLYNYCDSFGPVGCTRQCCAGIELRPFYIQKASREPPDPVDSKTRRYEIDEHACLLQP